MFTQLFPNDRWLYGRGGTCREYGIPEKIAQYADPVFSHDYAFSELFPVENGYILLYMGAHRINGRYAVLAAFSKDAIHFEPMNTGDTGEEKMSINQVFCLKKGEEAAAAVCDPDAPSGERYKLILTKADPTQECAYGYLLTSPDLIHWHNNGRILPGWKSEPPACIFRNEKNHCFTVSRRRTWGDRSVGYTDSKDLRDFSAFQMCVNQDALDEPLDEVYAMPVFPYKGAYIGFPYIYTKNAPSRFVKYKPGNIYPQLAYSDDGHYWQRSLRKSFLPAYHGQDGCFWLNEGIAAKDGSILLYCAHTFRAHGYSFSSHDSGVLEIYRLREDGFWALRCENETAVVTTREFCYLGGDITINLKAAFATCAILCTDTLDSPIANDLTVQGYDHSNCKPFSGDSTSWSPVFSGGRLECFEGKTILIEVRYSQGSLYSISGNLVPLMNHEAGAYRLTRELQK